MITKKEFLTEFNGHGNAYSSYMVIDVGLQDLIKALNEINPDMCVGSGVVSKNGKSVYFEICKELPDLIADITAKLHCKGFADIGGWYGSGYFAACYDGEEYDDYTADWMNDCPERHDYDYPDYDYDDEDNDADTDMEWDAFVVVTDNETGEVFYTGEGAVDYETMLMWEELVETH